MEGEGADRIRRTRHATVLCATIVLGLKTDGRTNTGVLAGRISAIVNTTPGELGAQSHVISHESICRGSTGHGGQSGGVGHGPV